MERKDCGHKTLTFQSGDYYLMCVDCPATWVMAYPGACRLYTAGTPAESGK